jgi:multidrug transporter EmrE-like cation transporter
MNFLPVIIYSLLYAALNVSGAALVKSELASFKLVFVKDYIQFLFRWKVMLGFTIILLSALVLFKALSIARFSVVNPVATGINFAFTLAMGYFAFNDRISLTHIFGLALILAGIIIISMAERG